MSRSMSRLWNNSMEVPFFMVSWRLRTHQKVIAVVDHRQQTDAGWLGAVPFARLKHHLSSEQQWTATIFRVVYRVFFIAGVTEIYWDTVYMDIRHHANSYSTIVDALQYSMAISTMKAAHIITVTHEASFNNDAEVSGWLLVVARNLKRI